MFSLRVDSFKNAFEAIRLGLCTHAVSLLGDKDAIAPLHERHHIELFDDIETDRPHHVDPDEPAKGYWIAPTRVQIARVLDFTAGLTDEDKLIVHCRAGKSRSTAMAIGILIQHGVEPADAFEKVREIRPMLIPNRLMIAYIDDHFALNGALIDIVSRYFERLTIPGISLIGIAGSYDR